MSFSKLRAPKTMRHFVTMAGKSASLWFSSPGCSGITPSVSSLDGKDLGGGGGRSTSVTLSNVDRGSHRVHATVVGKDGEQIVSTAAVNVSSAPDERHFPVDPVISNHAACTLS